jgi:hypothetical protein
MTLDWQVIDRQCIFQASACTDVMLFFDRYNHSESHDGRLLTQQPAINCPAASRTPFSPNLLSTSTPRRITPQSSHHSTPPGLISQLFWTVHRKSLPFSKRLSLCSHLGAVNDIHSMREWSSIDVGVKLYNVFPADTLPLHPYPPWMQPRTNPFL